MKTKRLFELESICQELLGIKKMPGVEKAEIAKFVISIRNAVAPYRETFAQMIKDNCRGITPNDDLKARPPEVLGSYYWKDGITKAEIEKFLVDFEALHDVEADFNPDKMKVKDFTDWSIKAIVELDDYIDKGRR